MPCSGHAKQPWWWCRLAKPLCFSGIERSSGPSKAATRRQGQEGASGLHSFWRKRMPCHEGIYAQQLAHCVCVHARDANTSRHGRTKAAGHRRHSDTVSYVHCGPVVARHRFYKKMTSRRVWSWVVNGERPCADLMAMVCKSEGGGQLFAKAAPARGARSEVDS